MRSCSLAPRYPPSEKKIEMLTACFACGNIVLPLLAFGFSQKNINRIFSPHGKRDNTSILLLYFKSTVVTSTSASEQSLPPFRNERSVPPFSKSPLSKRRLRLRYIHTCGREKNIQPAHKANASVKSNPPSFTPTTEAHFLPPLPLTAYPLHRGFRVATLQNHNIFRGKSILYSLASKRRAKSFCRNASCRF